MKTDTLQLKKEMLMAALAKQEGVIEDLRNRISHSMTNDDNAGTGHLSDQLQFAIQELHELKRLEFDLASEPVEVAFGSVVVTDNGTFFVSAGIDEFYIEGRSILALSILSPIYRVMKGMIVGEAFKYAGKRYMIREIH